MKEFKYVRDEYIIAKIWFVVVVITIIVFSMNQKILHLDIKIYIQKIKVYNYFQW